MARRYSRKKGKSGSTKPSNAAKPSWLRYKPKEVEVLVAKLAKDGKSTSEIGLVLRDSYGIPSVKLVTEKSISAILAEKELVGKLPEDLMFLIRRAVDIRKHLVGNHKDQPARRGLVLTESKINRLVRYYKKNHRLAPDFKYRAENARFYLE